MDIDEKFEEMMVFIREKATELKLPSYIFIGSYPDEEYACEMSVGVHEDLADLVLSFIRDLPHVELLVMTGLAKRMTDEIKEHMENEPREDVKH